MIQTSEWIRDVGFKVVLGVGILLLCLSYFALVAFLMRPTLEAIETLL